MSNESHSSSGSRSLKAVFVGLGVLGTIATWGRTVGSGSLGLITAALEQDEYTLPGSACKLLPSFTGIGPVDYLLRTLVVFFWESVDGSHPKNAAAGLYFAGQMAPTIVAIYLDGLRRGNGASLLRPVLWYLVFAAAAVGSSGAAWALVYLASSPTLSPSVGLSALQDVSLVASPIAASLLLPATLVAFAGTTVLMGIPSPTVVSGNFQQWAIVIWNVFPLILVAIVYALQPLLGAVLAGRQLSDRQAHLRAVRWLGVGSVVFGFAMHASVTAVSFSAALFPAIFAPGYAEALRPLSLAVPPIGMEVVRTPGDGIWGFMLWDQVFGFTMFMLVFLAQLQNSMRFSDQPLGSFSWARMAVVCLLSSFLVGPGTTIMAVSWLRDEVLYGVTPKIHSPWKADAKKLNRG
ncbi:hypothetical protein GGS23DRAFT_168284 [Durotheca rogersii]|uniref:uncharacterized protein n=1 Tax=Durotheca rogersii TaxID=419775 RepID=UPI00221F0374|nr:uncharacterized protein GGS23DRAFT_168284 [Durotheca rogersii]KAI5867265.1 hypothetical protein GGS23DRAFT_168284 [Durotheca rogersii]